MTLIEVGKPGSGKLTTVRKRDNGGLSIRQGDQIVLLNPQELSQIVDIAFPPVTPAKMQRYRMG